MMVEIRPEWQEQYERFLKAAESGNMDYLRSEIEKKENKEDDELPDYLKAMYYATPKAIQGNWQAQFLNATLMLIGHFSPESTDTAVSLLKKSAKQNYAPAQFSLAFAYMHGTCVSKDSEKALKLFRRAAKSGLARAQHMLGMILILGEMENRDLAEGEKWLLKSAESGFSMSKCDLGMLYSVIQHDDAKAFPFYLAAGNEGCSQAYHFLFRAYSEGLGTEVNPEEARKWKRKMEDTAGVSMGNI